MTSILKKFAKDQRGSLTLPLRSVGLLGHRPFLPQLLSYHGNHLLATITSQLTRRNLMVAGGVILYVSSIAYGVAFFWPRSLKLSYASATCSVSPVILPNLVKPQPNPNFSVTFSKSLSIAGYPLYSHSTCISPNAAPVPNTHETIKLIPFGSPILHKRFTISTSSLPKISPDFGLTSPIASTWPLTFNLDQADTLFDYQLLANQKTAPCNTKDRQVVCALSALELIQSKEYELKLERTFLGKTHGTVFQKTIITADPVQVTNSSIAPKAMVYNVPSEIVLTFNKPLASLGAVKLEQLNGAERKTVAVISTHTGNSASVRFDQPLARNTSFELTLEQAEAEDHSRLDAPYVLAFQTSGGPKVLGASIGSYKVQTSSSITLTFDAGLAPNQALANFVRIETSSGTVSSVITANGKTITINPSASLPHCTAFKVKVLDGLVNEHGISGSSAWTLNSRTICQTVFSIGTSVLGRSITAYRFGSGPSKIIFVGGMHGNEKSSVYTLNGLVNYLESNAPNISSNRTIVVIPNLNPDGFAASSRTNANNVDLNRNFPANDWQTGIYMPGNVYLPNGGGSAPLSEPESKALADYVVAQNPRLVLTYHAVARVVISNDAGDSYGQALTYGSKSGYPALRDSESGETFDYDTTGEFEDWLHDKQSLPALLIELGTMSSNEFNTHRSAMWSMAQIP